jgi:hypothetical protein
MATFELDITLMYRRSHYTCDDAIYATIQAVRWIKENIGQRASMNYRERCSASSLMILLERYACIRTDKKTFVALMRLAGFETKEKDGEDFFNISDKTEIITHADLSVV